jgi:hypothetical protein
MNGPLRLWLFLAASSAPVKPFAGSTARALNCLPCFENQTVQIREDVAGYVYNHKLRRNQSDRFSCHPPASHSDQRPYSFDHPEWPCSLQKAVYRTKHAGPAERQDEPPASIFERVAHQHRGHCKKPEEREAAHLLRIPVVRIRQRSKS